MGKYRMQMIFGLPILVFAMASIMLDAFGKINIEKIGYAFFGSIITLILNYYFRKNPPPDGGTNVKPD